MVSAFTVNMAKNLNMTMPELGRNTEKDLVWAFQTKKKANWCLVIVFQDQVTVH